VVVLGSSARLEPETAVRPIIELAGAGLPIAVFLAPHAPQATAALTAAGVPSFRTPESCADAVTAIFSRRFREIGPGAVGAGRDVADPAIPDQLGDEHAAYQTLDALGVPRVPTIVLDGDEPADLPFDYPVAAKVLSAQIPHKTDVGGVVLGIADAPSLREAMRVIRSNVAAQRPDLPSSPPILVEPMVTGLAEVLVGYRVDRQAGPIVLVAAGGELAEMYADRSLRLAPVDLPTAREMIREVRSLRVLAGYRGRPPADSEALAQVIVNLSNLALDSKVSELEINPLLVRGIGQGVIAVDALVRARDTAQRTPSDWGVPS
jgi:acyl-CoA synthetase (NDP forming)